MTIDISQYSSKTKTEGLDVPKFLAKYGLFAKSVWQSLAGSNNHSFLEGFCKHNVINTKQFVQELSKNLLSLLTVSWTF